MSSAPTPDQLEELPTINAIHSRLGEIAREQFLLRKLLRLALRLREEKANQKAKREVITSATPAPESNDSSTP